MAIFRYCRAGRAFDRVGGGTIGFARAVRAIRRTFMGTRSWFAALLFSRHTRSPRAFARPKNHPAI